MTDPVPFSMPFTELLDVQIERAGPEEVVGTMTVREALCTTGKRLHGGAIMAFADSLGAIGAYLKPRVARYIADLERSLQQARFDGKLSIVQANGGESGLPIEGSDAVDLPGVYEKPLIERHGELEQLILSGE